MIEGIVGEVGSGKTLHLSKLGIDLMKRGFTVVSNTPISFTWKKHKFTAIYISDSKQFMGALVNGKHIKILLDEAGNFLPANFWYKVPPELSYKLSQTRHFLVDLYYTVQNYSHSFKKLRDLTNWVMVCQRRKFFIPHVVTKSERVFDEKDSKFHLSKYHVLQRYVYFHATMFKPEFFKHNLLKDENIRKFIIRENNIYPSEARRLFKAYNSWQDTRTSGVGELKLDDNFQELSLQNAVQLVNEDTPEAPKLAQDEFSEQETYDLPSI